MVRALLVAILAAVPSARAQTILHVSDGNPAPGDGLSWETAFPYLQDALAAAAAAAGAGDSVQVWIADGTYLPDRSAAVPAGTGDPLSTFVVPNRVSLYGGFAGGETSVDQRDAAVNIVILNGDLLGDDASGGLTDNSRSILTISNNDVLTTIDGLTVTAGGPRHGLGGAALVTDSQVAFTDCAFVGNGTWRSSFGRGGAVDFNGGSASFLRCRFLNNRTGFSAGAICFNGDSARFQQCTFEGNRAGGSSLGSDGGAILIESGEVLVEDSTFRTNSAYGLGGAISGQNIVIRRSMFESNASEDRSGGAVSGSAMIADSSFLSNWAFISGGAVSANAGTSLVNCHFVLNNNEHGVGSAASGAATYVNCSFSGNGFGSATNPLHYALAPASAAEVIGCTFYGNDGGALYAISDVTVSDSIFWANGPDGPPDEAHQILGDPQVNYSFIAGLTGSLGGVGNIGAYPYDDPLFVDADGADNVPGTPDDDLRLRAGSPCIDAGDNSAVPPGTTTDFDGLDRFRDDPGAVDTGYGSPPLVDMGAHEFQGVTCTPDINHDGFADGVDYDLFNNLFALGDPAADYNRDGYVDGIDYDHFNNDFEAGC